MGNAPGPDGRPRHPRGREGGRCPARRHLAAPRAPSLQRDRRIGPTRSRPHGVDHGDPDRAPGGRHPSRRQHRDHAPSGDRDRHDHRRRQAVLEPDLESRPRRPRRPWRPLMISGVRHLTARALRFSILVSVVLLLAGLSARAEAQTPKRGGVIRVAVLGDPPTLDAHWTTANFVEVITQHIYEGLYTLDQSYQPIPDLAEALPQVSADGLVYTIKLRQGIKFHNGKEMTSDDVVASLNRWGGYAVQAKSLWASVEEVRPVGKYAIELRLKEKSGVVLISLANANNFGAIYPKEIAEKFPTPNKVTEFIGTGPYRFVEWKPDSHIRMARFDGYAARSEPAS